MICIIEFVCYYYMPKRAHGFGHLSICICVPMFTVFGYKYKLPWLCFSNHLKIG